MLRIHDLQLTYSLLFVMLYRSTRVKMLDLLLELPSCQTTERLDTATQTEEVERNMPKEATVEENAAPAKKGTVSMLTVTRTIALA